MPDNVGGSGGTEGLAPSLSETEIGSTISGLENATRNFASRVESLRAAAEEFAPAPYDEPEVRQTLEQRLQAAEVEAREYLERAKRRADSLVNSMIGAVEREADAIQRDAEDRIRARWAKVEREADEYLGEARSVADAMVAERQDQISSLSDTITSRAGTLTRGMGDAERVQKQFDDFVRALSRTADEIARRSEDDGRSAITELRARRPGVGRDSRAA